MHPIQTLLGFQSKFGYLFFFSEAMLGKIKEDKAGLSEAQNIVLSLWGVNKMILERKIVTGKTKIRL